MVKYPRQGKRAYEAIGMVLASAAGEVEYRGACRIQRAELPNLHGVALRGLVCGWLAI